MDSHFLNGIGTVFAFIAFVSVCIWAYSKKRKRHFDEAAQLPFADDDMTAGQSDSSDSASRTAANGESARSRQNAGGSSHE